jgi:2-oxo-3-hexenedioate decarboxylase
MASETKPPSASTDEIAAELVSLLGTGRQIAPFSKSGRALDLPSAYRITAAVRRLREARGEHPVGRKIGFTNRTIWAEYGVFAPIWGYMYAGTVHELPAGGGAFSLAGLVEPRIEPEIVFGLAKSPSPDMDEKALLACIDWVAHGFEIVQSLFPRWEFAAADVVAAFGLHGALHIGERRKLQEHDPKKWMPVLGEDHAQNKEFARDAWLGTLPGLEIDLVRDGAVMDHGKGANVLDGPLSALRHFVGLLATDTTNPPLAAGEIVTTGTLTRALPVKAGESWETRLSGVDLAPIALRFV